MEENPHLSISKSKKKTKSKCIVPQEFRPAHTIEYLLSFVQGNTNVNLPEDIWYLGLLGSFESFVGSQVFLNNHWITSITPDYEQPTGYYMYVEFWPRIELQVEEALHENVSPCSFTISNKMVIIYIYEAFDLVCNIPPGHGVEFIANKDGTLFNIKGDIVVEGRLSIKSFIVDFSNGSLDAKGPTVFQSSLISGAESFPYSFQEVEGEYYFYRKSRKIDMPQIMSVRI